MTDLEKIIKGLEQAKDVIERWIPMFEQYNTPCVIDCAITMLKEQEEKYNKLAEWSEGHIVFCKDCKHYNKPHSGCCENEIPHGYAETWFCADGKRR